MPKAEWVTSVGAFPIAFRSRICSSTLGRLRRDGTLIKGTDYETIENAVEKGLDVHGYEQGRPTRSRYVYHIKNCMDRLSDRL